MRRAAAAVAALLMLAACHGSDHRGVTLDADEDARNATGTKIEADLAAADAAARRPLAPAARPPQASAAEETPASAEATGSDDGRAGTPTNDD